MMARICIVKVMINIVTVRFGTVAVKISIAEVRIIIPVRISKAKHLHSKRID